MSWSTIDNPIVVRILIGLLLASAAWLLAFRASSPVILASVALLALLSLREYFGIVAASGLRPYRTLGYAGALVWLLCPNLDRALFSSLYLILLLGTGVLAGRPIPSVLPSAAVTAAGVLYIAGPLLWGMLLHDLSPHWLVLALVVTAIGDTIALAVGKTIGRHPIAPVVSPSKTWEGTIASAIFGPGAGVAYAAIFLPGEIGKIEAVVLAVVINVFGQIGDLAESALKRTAEIKNSGQLLPGHGGVLDRIDGLLFALPALYGYLQFLR